MLKVPPRPPSDLLPHLPLLAEEAYIAYSFHDPWSSSWIEEGRRSEIENKTFFLATARKSLVCEVSAYLEKIRRKEAEIESKVQFFLVMITLAGHSRWMT